MEVLQSLVGVAIEGFGWLPGHLPAGRTDKVDAEPRQETDPEDHLRRALGQETELFLEPAPVRDVAGDPLDQDDRAVLVKEGFRREFGPAPPLRAVAEPEPDRGGETVRSAQLRAEPWKIDRMDRITEQGGIGPDLVGADPGEIEESGIHVPDRKIRADAERDGDVQGPFDHEGGVFGSPGVRRGRDEEHTPSATGGPQLRPRLLARPSRPLEGEREVVGFWRSVQRIADAQDGFGVHDRLERCRALHRGQSARGCTQVRADPAELLVRVDNDDQWTFLHHISLLSWRETKPS